MECGEVKCATSRPDLYYAPKLDGDSELQNRRSLGLWLTTCTCIHMSLMQTSLFCWTTEIWEPIITTSIIKYAQAFAMQIEIQIIFNEMKFNEISPQFCHSNLNYNTSLL